MSVGTASPASFAGGPARIAVLGAGCAGCAIAASAAARGHEVRLWNRSPNRLADLHDRTVLLAEPGDVPGTASGHARQLAWAGTDLAEACADADLVVLTVSSSAQPELAAQVWPLARQTSAIVLVPGHTGGIFAARHAAGLPATGDAATTDEDGPAFAEMPLPFVCRAAGPGQVRILQYKRDVPLATVLGGALADVLPLLAGIFPAVRAATDPWETGLGNTTAVIQPVLALANLARIDRGNGSRSTPREQARPSGG